MGTAAEYNVLTQKVAQQEFGNQPDLRDAFWRMIYQESGFSPDVVEGQRRSSAGAQGIAQIMPFHKDVNPYNPEEALHWAANYLRSSYKYYGGDLAKSVASYNAGIGNVDKAISIGGANWQQALPKVVNSNETNSYLAATVGPQAPSTPWGQGVPALASTPQESTPPTNGNVSPEEWANSLDLVKNKGGKIIPGVISDSLGNWYDDAGNVVTKAGHLIDPDGKVLGKIDKDAMLRAGEGFLGGVAAGATMGMPGGLFGMIAGGVLGGAAAGIFGSSDHTVGGVVNNIMLGGTPVGLAKIGGIAKGLVGRIFGRGAGVAGGAAAGAGAATAAPAAVAALTNAGFSPAQAAALAAAMGGGGGNNGNKGGRFSVGPNGPYAYDMSGPYALMLSLPQFAMNAAQVYLGVQNYNQTDLTNRNKEEIERAALFGTQAKDVLEAQIQGLSIALANRELGLSNQTNEAIAKGTLMETSSSNRVNEAINQLQQVLNYNETNRHNVMSEQLLQAATMGTLSNNIATNQRALQQQEIDKVSKALEVAKYVQDAKRWNAQNIMPVGMDYLPGFEPNGLWAQAGASLGLKMTPVKLNRVNPKEFDPVSIFEGAQKIMPGKMSADESGMTGMQNAYNNAAAIKVAEPNPVDFNQVSQQTGLDQRGKTYDAITNINIPQRTSVPNDVANSFSGMGAMQGSLDRTANINIPAPRPITGADIGLDQVKGAIGSLSEYAKRAMSLNPEDILNAIKRQGSGSQAVSPTATPQIAQPAG